VLVTGICCCLSHAWAEKPYFTGVLGGLSILSGDARSVVTTNSAAVSLYEPKNGAVIHFFGGVHLHEYLSVQGNYVWNRNDLILTSSNGPVFYEQGRRSSQHGVSADLSLYFRNRQSWIRPYLSIGAGVVRFHSKETRVISRAGSAALPPAEFTSTGPALRVAVGMDLSIRKGWAFRYSFCETIRSNPVSEVLSPPGRRALMNFQNLFGIVKSF